MLYFVGIVAVVLLLLSLSVTELPGHTMLQRRGGVHVSQRRGLADGAAAPDAAESADDAPAAEQRTAGAPRALRNLLAVLATPLGPRRPDSPERVSAARLEELYRVFRRPLPANGRVEIDRRFATSRPNFDMLELGHIEVDSSFGRIDRSRRVLEAGPKRSCRPFRIRAH